MWTHDNEDKKEHWCWYVEVEPGSGVPSHRPVIDVENAAEAFVEDCKENRLECNELQTEGENKVFTEIDALLGEYKVYIERGDKPLTFETVEVCPTENNKK